MDGLTQQERFRMGFLLRCAEEGCDRDEIQTRVKLAKELPRLIKEAEGFTDHLTNLASWLVKYPVYGVGASMAGAGALGLYGGRQLGKAMGEARDPEEIKQQELAALYRMHADRIRQRAKQRSYRQAPVPAEPQLMS